MTRKEAWHIGRLILTRNKGVFAGAFGIILGILFAASIVISVLIMIFATLLVGIQSEMLLDIIGFIVSLPCMFMGAALTLGFMGLGYRLYCGQQCSSKDVLYYLYNPKLVFKMIGLHLTIWGIPIIAATIVLVFTLLLLVGTPMQFFMLILPLLFWAAAIVFNSTTHASNIFLIIYPDLPFRDMLKVSVQVGLRNCGTYFIMMLQTVGVGIGVSVAMLLAIGLVGSIVPLAMILILPFTLAIYVGAILLGIWLNISLTVYYTAHIVQSGYAPDGRIQA